MTRDHHPLVTIGIPTYNRADNYLKQVLDSAVKQTYMNIEIVVSDNCSIDNTEAVVKSFKDPRIRYFKQKTNLGRIGNSNFLLEQANGEYFQQLQDDDSIDPDFVETCMKAADYSSEVGIIQTGTRIINSDGNVTHEYPYMTTGTSIEDYFIGWFSCKTSWYLCSTLFNTHWLKEVGGFKSKRCLFDDVVAMVKVAAKHKSINIQHIKASFRKHSGEETFAASIKDWCEDSIYLLNLMCDLVPESSRSLIEKEGSQFFSTINYLFTSAVKSRPKRILAYLAVYKAFGYTQMPPPLKAIIYYNPLSNGLRSIKHNLRA